MIVHLLEIFRIPFQDLMILLSMEETHSVMDSRTYHAVGAEIDPSVLYQMSEITVETYRVEQTGTIQQALRMIGKPHSATSDPKLLFRIFDGYAEHLQQGQPNVTFFKGINGTVCQSVGMKVNGTWLFSASSVNVAEVLVSQGTHIFVVSVD